MEATVSVVEPHLAGKKRRLPETTEKKESRLKLAMYPTMLPPPYYGDPDKRKRQIDTLKIFNDHVVEIKENSEYRVEFFAGNRNMSLDVILGPEFPNEKPVILVSPMISHPWVAENSNIVIGAPGLLNFTVHSDLGRVVQAIIREFMKSAPQNDDTKGTENRLSAISPLNTSGSIVFPELNDMTAEELQELAENQDLQDKFLEKNPKLIELDYETEELLNNIETIAKENLSKQQLLVDLKSGVINRISTIAQLKSNFEELNRKHQKLSEAYDPYKIRDCLHEAAVNADEEAELIAEQFLSGNIPVDAFVAQYAEKRALGQNRRARGERLAHQLEQLDKATL